MGKKKHSHIHSEYHKVEKRRAPPRIKKTKKILKFNQPKNSSLKRKRPSEGVMTHSLISQESEPGYPDSNSGSKHLTFPQESHVSPVNQTQAVQHQTLIKQSEYSENKNPNPGNIKELVQEGTEEQVIKHINYGKGKLVTQVETIKRDKNGKVVSRNTEKFLGKHLIMI